MYYGGAQFSDEGRFSSLDRKISILHSFVDYNGIVPVTFLDYYKYLFLDSGAFAAFTRNAQIDINQYMKFIDFNRDKIKTYACLDVIGDPETSFKNYMVMKKAGFDPMPAIHLGEDRRYMDMYLEHTNYIGIGGVAQAKSSKQLLIFLDNIFFNLLKGKRVGFHGFAVTNIKLMKRYPWQSVDSTSALKYAIFGGVYTEFGMYKISEAVDPKYLKWATPVRLKKVKESLEKLGFSWELARRGDSEGCGERLKINVDFFERLVESTIEDKSSDCLLVENLF